MVLGVLLVTVAKSSAFFGLTAAATGVAPTWRPLARRKGVVKVDFFRGGGGIKERDIDWQ